MTQITENETKEALKKNRIWGKEEKKSMYRMEKGAKAETSYMLMTTV